MAGSVRVFIASSLDGFIAGGGDDLSWLPEPDPGGEDYGFGAFMAETAAMVMGRNTFDVVAGFPEWPYGDTPVFVATSRPLDPPRPTVGAVSGTPARMLEQVRASAPGSVYVDGGVLIRAFLDAGLVDEITVTVIPVILGAGIPLFAGTAERRALTLVDSRSYPSGLVQLRYSA